MGKMITMKCGNCGFTKEFQIGCGLASRNPKVIASSLKGEDAEQWKQLEQANALASFRSERRLTYCKHCDELKDVMQADVRTMDGQKITLGRNCGQCGEPLETIGELEHVQCPHCKNGELEVRNSGLWD